MKTKHLWFQSSHSSRSVWLFVCFCRHNYLYFKHFASFLCILPANFPMKFQKYFISDECYSKVSWCLPFQVPQSSSPKSYLVENCQKNLHLCCICHKLSSLVGNICLEHHPLVHWLYCEGQSKAHTHLHISQNGNKSSHRRALQSSQ